MNSRMLSMPITIFRVIINTVGDNIIIRSMGAMISKAGDLLARDKTTTTRWLQAADPLKAYGLAENTVLTTAPSYIHTATRLILMGLSDIQKDRGDLAAERKTSLMSSIPVQGPMSVLEDLEEEEKEAKSTFDNTCTKYYFFKSTAIIAVSFDTISAYFYTLQFINFANSATAYFAPGLCCIGGAAPYALATLNAGLYAYMYYSKLTTIPEELIAWKGITDPEASCYNNLRIVGDAIVTAGIAYGSSSMIGNHLFPSSIEQAPKTAQETIQITLGVVGAVAKGLYRFVDNGKPLKKDMGGELEPSKSRWAQRHYTISRLLAGTDSFFTGWNGTNGLVTMANDVGHYAGFSCTVSDLTCAGKPVQKAYIVTSFTLNMLFGAPATYAKHKDYIKKAYRVIKQPDWITPSSSVQLSPPLSSVASGNGSDYGTFTAPVVTSQSLSESVPLLENKLSPPASRDKKNSLATSAIAPKTQPQPIPFARAMTPRVMHETPLDSIEIAQPNFSTRGTHQPIPPLTTMEHEGSPFLIFSMDDINFLPPSSLPTKRIPS